MANSHIESRTRQTDRVFREIMEKDRAAVLAKTERLRALRLAREAEGDVIAMPDAKTSKAATARRSG